MIRRVWPPRSIPALVLISTVSWGACGAKLKTRPPVAAPTVATTRGGPAALPPAPSAQAAAVDPVEALIADSDRHFTIGQRELQLGHAEAARQEFNLAIDLLLESPFGGRTEPRVREHFDRLVDRISAYEVKALAEGDGFTEQKYEPASIDELLALSTTFGDAGPTSELQAVVQADLQTTEHDIAIPLNRRVLSYIELFQGRLHDFIEVGLRRGSKYLPMIQNVFRAEGLPLDLAYVPLIESAFNPNALSRAKAKGVWQFMAGTAVENGLRRDWYIDERSDPEKATVAAARYLKTLGGAFDGDWHLALASYNGGPGRVQRAVKRAGIDDFWVLAEKPSLLPRETREYVPMILAAIVIAKNPTHYGFEAFDAPPPAFDQIRLARPADLRRVAEWAGTTIAEIQSLNPELRRWTTPIRDAQYALRLPPGTAERVAAQLDHAPPVDVTSLNWYTVKRGDTLPLIARKLRVSKADLAEANYLPVTARVSAGRKLIVPRETTALMAARAERPIPLAESRPLAAQPALMAQQSANSGRVKMVYQVKEGDTLSSIAKLFRTTAASIKTWNGLSGNSIAAGAHLTVYAVRAARNIG